MKDAIKEFTNSLWILAFVAIAIYGIIEAIRVKDKFERKLMIIVNLVAFTILYFLIR